MNFSALFLLSETYSAVPRNACKRRSLYFVCGGKKAQCSRKIWAAFGQPGRPKINRAILKETCGDMARGVRLHFPDVRSNHWPLASVSYYKGCELLYK